ncbi:TIGR04255 family protein [Erwinia rhapontici]|uniref:TIGR04255 family protein n=1 Tax=Erwinia rhapontici TaxID=55212 RepID=UPI003BA0039E
MKEKFENSPLVELVAEVRWSNDFPLKQPIMPGDKLDLLEEFFTKVTSELASRDYVTSERLVPKGFPLLAGNPIVRFKKSPSSGTPEEKAKELSTLFQVGVGVFTINAIQPYSCWDDLKSVIRIGLDALLNAKPEMSDSGFKISVRYINAFGESFTDGVGLRRFLSEKFGVAVTLPPALKDEFTTSEIEIPAVRVRSPLKFGTHVINFSEGKVKSQSVYLMENIVNLDNDIESDADKLLEEMSLARDVIHKRFFAMTKALHSKMKLV